MIPNSTAASYMREELKSTTATCHHNRSCTTVRVFTTKHTRVKTVYTCAFDQLQLLITNTLKLQAVSHNTTRLIIPASTLVLAQTLTSVTISQGSFSTFSGELSKNKNNHNVPVTPYLLQYSPDQF